MRVVTSKPAKDIRPDSAEWRMRVDLAAAHRLAYQHGFSEGIFNHLTCSVPGKPDRYLQIPFGLHWSEITASCFLEVSHDGKVLKGEGEGELSGYCIHSPIHRLIPDAVCVMHTHMPFASALARLEDPRIQPIGQTEVGMM
jgi:ribulose-5-phosphate 4-epimerase/fuculose-1-phosphate aldolase